MPPSNIGLAALARCLLRAVAASHLRRAAAFAFFAALVAGVLAACHHPPQANPHYVLDRPYYSGGTWWYPRETYNLDETGLAAVYSDDHPSLTTDGEVFSQGALAVAHGTVQLPAIARLTDLETGRSMLVRINDRGTPTPARLVQVTRRVAALLGMPPDGVAQVRLTLLPGPSQAAAQQMPGAPALPIAAAPRGGVVATTLAPLPGSRQESGHAVTVPAAAADPDAGVPDHLSESVTQGPPHPGRLWVRLDAFQDYQYAAIERAKLTGLSPHIESVFQDRVETFRVMIGPLPSVAAADAAVDAAVHAGVVDARIVVE